jgi:AcrR family transcriptional regulator
MPRGRSPGYDDQRELIRSHAARLFAQRGYPATSMKEVAEACGMSKPALYHYFRDKYALLVDIAEGHVARLEARVDEVDREGLAPEPRLRQLIHRFLEEYATAQHAHRVLTEDVKFLEPDDRARILAAERRIVAGFARAATALRPQLQQSRMAKPLTMLLFGMINWMFTWLKPDGELTYAAMAPVVADLFFGGMRAVRPPSRAARSPNQPRELRLARGGKP